MKRVSSKSVSSPKISPTAVVAGLLFGAAALAAAKPGVTYQIYAGSTHAHTQFTWSHGEQWEAGGAEESGDGDAKKTGKADAAKKKKEGLAVSAEGLQGPPVGKKLKSDWEKNNQGKPAAHFARAKARGFDFYITTDHSQEVGFNPPSADNPLWTESHAQAKAATDKDFVALIGYEHSENNGPGGSGHINVINSAEYLNALAPGTDLPTLYKWLQTVKSAGDGPVVATFNHPSAKQYNEFAYRDEGVTEIITMLEMINSNKNLHYAGFLAALDKGWKVSPVAGNDNHGFSGIEKHTSRTFVLATAKTKAAILEAMKHRRTYASLESNLQCRYTANDAIMGSTLNKPDSIVFDIEISDPDTSEPKDAISKIDIVTDGGEIAATFETAPTHALSTRITVASADKKYFFIRVWNTGGGDLANAKAGEPVAWLAPVWTGR